MSKKKWRAQGAALALGISLLSLSCRPPAAVVASCKPIPAAQLRGIDTVGVIGNFAPYEPRKTDDPHLVLQVLKALEHGMVDDPEAEARIRWKKPYNGFLSLEHRRAGIPGRNLRIIYFDATEFYPPRYRKEFVDAVTAAYGGGKDVNTFNSLHPDPSALPSPKPGRH